MTGTLDDMKEPAGFGEAREQVRQYMDGKGPLPETINKEMPASLDYKTQIDELESRVDAAERIFSRFIGDRYLTGALTSMYAAQIAPDESFRDAALSAAFLALDMYRARTMSDMPRGAQVPTTLQEHLDNITGLQGYCMSHGSYFSPEPEPKKAG